MDVLIPDVFEWLISQIGALHLPKKMYGCTVAFSDGHQWPLLGETIS